MDLRPDTPALLVDLDALDFNIQTMANFFAGKSVALRPHAKTHKCPQIAQKQIQAGAIGITCAKVSEAEVMARAGINMVHVPYKGGGPASAAVVGGNEVQALFGSLPSLLPHVKTGRIKALGVTGSARSAVAPGVPTIAESGFPGYDVTSWHGLLVPARTPERIVKTIYVATLKILEMPDVRQAIQRVGLEIETKDPKQFAARIKAEAAVWANVIKSANIRID